LIIERKAINRRRDRSRLDSMLVAGVFLEFIQADGAARLHVLNGPADAIEHLRFLSNLAKLPIVALQRPALLPATSPWPSTVVSS
jgi:hypothetical protein